MLYHHLFDRKIKVEVVLSVVKMTTMILSSSLYVLIPIPSGFFSVKPLFCQKSFAWENSRNFHKKSVRSFNQARCCLDA